MPLRLGTRASLLALTQSRQMARRLEKSWRGLRVQLIEISTTGDQVRNKPLRSFGGTGVFVKELETALAAGKVDFAVHSLKDLPTRQPRGLVLAAVVGRADPRDAAIIRGGRKLAALPAGSVLGSGSLRRRAQLKHAYPHLEFAEIRGNVETRLRKVTAGQYAGTILACAGLRRLKLRDRITETLPLQLVLPAPGQGALGLECRARDAATRRLLRKIHDAQVAACVTAERAVLEALGGGCHLPLGALGTLERRGGRKVLRLRAALGLPDGSKLVRVEETGAPRRPRSLGLKVARRLLADGGRAILKQLS